VLKPNQLSFTQTNGLFQGHNILQQRDHYLNEKEKLEFTITKNGLETQPGIYPYPMEDVIVG
jgi:hypothetical protein